MIFRSPYRDAWNIVYEVSDAELIMGLVACDFGITVMPEIPVTHLHPTVKLLRLSEPYWESHFYIMRHKANYLFPYIEAFHNFFVQTRQRELGLDSRDFARAKGEDHQTWI